MSDLASRLSIKGLTDPSREVRRPAIKKTKNPNPYVSAFPLSVSKHCVSVGCEAALPLILAIHRQLKMTGREWTPLNKAVWVSAGDPSEKKREKILRALKRHPELVQICPRKTATSHYDVAYGSLWLVGVEG
jgi:hypothetical protein